HNDNATHLKFNLSAQGGNENGSFYASGSYLQQEGQYKTGGLHRITGKLNVNHKFSDKLKVKNNLLGSYIKQNRYLSGTAYWVNAVTAHYFLLPSRSPYNTDGSLNIEDFGVAYNPVYILNHDFDIARNYRLRNATSLTYDILDNLSVKTMFSLDF